MPDRDLVVAVAATFTADPVKAPLDCFLDLLGIRHRVALAPYGQLLQQLVDEGGLLGQNRHGVDVALVRLSDLDVGDGRRTSAPDGEAMRRHARELGALATAHARREGAPPLLFCVCPEPRARLADPVHAALAAATEAELAAELRAAGVPVITSGDLLASYPVADPDDAAADELGHIPYTGELFAALGAVIARRIRALSAAPHKVLALDADNTLWTGVVGEDGPDGIVVDEGREALQRFALAQREAGMLLCLCSKNTAADVDEVFRRRAMPLRREHFAAVRVDWQPKSESLRSIAAELGLGLDAFVFLDDSSVECAEVSAGCPEVLTLNLPAGAADAAAFVHHVWAFDRWKVTDEDRRRSDLYQRDAEREATRQRAPSMAEFLAGLGLEIVIAAPEPGDLPRIAQLTFRTNQWNLTTVRRSEAEIAAALGGGGLECLAVRVRDRFGDHGLVGVLLFGAKDGALAVDTFLLSCRVLQRGVEHRMLARLGEIAGARGLSHVEAPLTFTAKNLPAQQFLRSFGDAAVSEHAEGLVLRLSAAHAAAAVYIPSTAPPPELNAAAPREPAAAVVDQHAAIACIARELTTAAALQVRVAGLGAKRQRPSIATAFVAPVSADERAVAELCEAALGMAPVGLTDDLFLDLGADSFTAVRIAAAMREKLGRPVQIADVQEARTVQRLAALRTAPPSVRRRSPSIHVLRAHGSKPPLFLARPATRSGGALSYVALARQVDEGRPVHVFQNRPLLDGTEPYAGVEAMAAEYLAALREVQPRGPYLLAGWCLGGKTAFEMANRLVAAGEQVTTLLLFDTAAPGGLADRVRFLARNALVRAELGAFSRHPRLERLLPWIKVARARSLLRRFGVLAYHAHDAADDVALIAYAFPGRFEVGALRAMTPEARWEHVYATLRAAEPGDGDGDGVDAAGVRRGFKYFALDHRMDAMYAPRWVYPGDVTMLTVRGGATVGDGWRRYLKRAPRVVELDLKGTKATPDPHSAMMSEDNVRLMAAEVNRALDGSSAF